MDTTRRAFLRGTAGVSAAAATGGANIAKSVLAGGASAAGALTQAERTSKVFETLGKTGGFPHNALSYILHTLQLGNAEKIKRRINGTDSWNRGTAGKIDFEWESMILQRLLQLPGNLNINDLLHDDVLNELVSPDHSEEGIVGTIYFEDTNITLEQARELKNALAPFCSSDTIVNDLVGQFSNYFKKLAQHAINNPKDFGEYDSSYHMLFGPYDGLSKLKNIIKKLAKNDKKLGQIAENLERTHEATRKLYEQDFRKKSARQHKEQKEAKRLFEEAKKKRYSFQVTLFYTGDHRYVLQNCDGNILPTKVDWLHWLQTIDPQSAKPADIGLDHLGMSVEIKNAKAQAFLKKQIASQEQSDKFTLKIQIELPNHRTDVNLHSEDTHSWLARKSVDHWNFSPLNLGLD